MLGNNVLAEAIEVVNRAFSMPEYQSLYTKPGNLALVILNPSIKNDGKITKLPEFQEVVVWGQLNWKTTAWKYKYDRIALSKAFIAWRNEMSMREVIEKFPDRLRKGDTVWPGALYKNGIVCSVSGQSPAIDEFLAELALNMINWMLNGITLPNIEERKEFYSQLSLNDKTNAENRLKYEEDCFIS